MKRGAIFSRRCGLCEIPIFRFATVEIAAGEGCPVMPTISMFYGIIIRMYCAPDEHPPPHFHALYAEHEAQIAIESGEVLVGSLPNNKLRMVKVWTELHKEELLADWQIAMNGEEPFKINPLR